MIAVDTSLVVAAFASWHEAHEVATRALARAPRLPSHVAIEALSVLTRLPPPHRATADVVADFLESRFPDPLLLLSEPGFRALIREVATKEVSGGAIYDALIAATARERDATLLSRDRRAAVVYERLGARYELLS